MDDDSLGPKKETDGRSLGLKEEIDSCTSLATLAYQSWNDRRQYEWKFTVGLWTALLLGAGFLSRDATINGWLCAGIETVVIVLYMIWLHGLWCANQFDRQRQFHYEGLATRLIVDPSTRIEHFPYSSRHEAKFTQDHLGLKSFLFHYSQFTYSMITVVLLFVVLLFTAGGISRKSDDRLKAIEENTLATKLLVEADARQTEQLRNDIVSFERAFSESTATTSKKRK